MKDHDRTKEQLIAELRKANEQLRIFQQFAEASGQGFSMADLGGHLLYMNPALCRYQEADYHTPGINR
jgi:PAS domain-containing protein